MVAECKKLGMKPVCDHPSYCRTNKAGLYIGQHSHIAYRPYRNINSWFPSGWSQISSNWDNLCAYTANANGNYAYCNIPINTHAWRHPGQYSPGFICGATTTDTVVKVPRSFNPGFVCAKFSTSGGAKGDGSIGMVGGRRVAKGELSYLNSGSAAGSGARVASFSYFMQGPDVGSLSFEASVGGKWLTVWSKKGAQQKSVTDAWRSSGSVKLPAGTAQVSTRILGRRTAPFPHFLIHYRVPHGFIPRSQY